ncbi:MAG: AtpZ/AtpI family protein [Ilumatobacteraceae bacterium]
MKLLPRKTINLDDNLGRGMDLALVTLVFLGVGYVMDRALDTKPVFMIILFVFAVVGQTLKMWFGYDARMKQLEAERAANRHALTKPRSGS